MPSVKSNKESSKTVQKKKEKIIEDKTFGLKNKKGSKQQKFIKNVAQQVANDPNQTKKKEKPKKEEDEFEFNKLFKPVVQEQKAKIGVDPKSQLCAFFKQGTCSKGDKCKFSHDLSIERKAEKRNIYADIRDEDDDMTKWDENKLEEVINTKHSEENKKLNKTDIICKHFLKALEDEKYGWFWECPNGGDKCIYRHALPVGYKLKQKGNVEKENKALIEDLLDQRILHVQTGHTKLDLATFRLWKAKRIKDKREKALKDTADKEAKYRAGKLLGLSGRDIFTFDPSLVYADDVNEGCPTQNGYGRDAYQKEPRSRGYAVDIDVGINEGLIDTSLFLRDDVDDEDGDNEEIEDGICDITALNKRETFENEIELELDDLVNLEMNKPSQTNINNSNNNHIPNEGFDGTPTLINLDEIDISQDAIEMLSKKIQSTF